MENRPSIKFNNKNLMKVYFYIGFCERLGCIKSD